MIRPASALLACFLASACATPPPVYKRWAIQDGLLPYSPPRLSVSSTPASASPATSKFRALGDREGAAYIKAVAASQEHPGDIAKAIAGLIKAEGAALDYTDLPRTLVVTIDRDNLRPADRLYQTKVTILADGFSFADYDPTATQITSIDVETMEAKREVTAGAELDPSFGGVLSAGKLTTGMDNSRDETAKLQENTVTNVQVYPGKVTIYRRGTVNVDLIGNTLVKVSAKALPTTVTFKALASNLSLSSDGADIEPAKASMDIEVVPMFQAQPLTVCARVEYVDREANDAAQKYYDESQHSVRLISANSGWQRYILVPAQEAFPTSWELFDSSGMALSADTPTGIRAIDFAAYDDAENFAAWVTRAKARSVGKLKLFTHDMRGRPTPVHGRLSLTPYVNAYAPATLPPCNQQLADAAVRRAEFYPLGPGSLGIASADRASRPAN